MDAMNKWFRSLFVSCSFSGQIIYDQVSISGELKVNNNEISIQSKLDTFSFEIENCEDFCRSCFKSGRISISWRFRDNCYQFIFNDPNDFNKISKRLGNIFQESQVVFQPTSLPVDDFYEKNTEIVFLSKGTLLIDDFLAEENKVFLILAKYPSLLSTLDILTAELIFRVWLSPKFEYKIDLDYNKIEWTDTQSTIKKKISIILGNSVKDLEYKLSRITEELSNYQLSPKNSLLSDLNSIKSDIFDDFYAENSETNIKNDDEIIDSVVSSTTNHIFVAQKNSLSVLSQDSLSLISKQSLSSAFNTSDFMPIHLLPSPSKLFTVNKNDPGSVYTFDLTRNKIVSNHKLPQNSIVKDLNFPTQSCSAEFLALTYDSLYKIDPRSVNYIVSEYSYETKQGLECFTPTFSGQLAVGTDSGEIKLFTKVGQKAKTRFPGFGQKIIAIECNENGEWILATTSKYLIIVPTMAYGVNGFFASITKRSRKIRQLEIKDSDLKHYGIENISFRPACFGKIKNNEVIVAAFGAFLVVWDFKMVQKGKVDKYKVICTEQEVVKNQFLKERGVIVVTSKQKVRVCDEFM